MISFITNMQNASQIVAECITARDLIDKWICDRDADFESAEAFLEAHAVTNVASGNGVTIENLDNALGDATTLSVYTKAVATGGVKAAC